MKIALTLLFLFCASLVSIAQEFNENELRSKLEKLSRKEQLKLIDSLANTYSVENNLIGIKQFDFLIGYVKKNNFPKNTIAGLFYARASLFRKQSEFSRAINDFKQAETIYSQLKDQKGLSSIYTGYSNLYFSVGDNIKAINYIHQAIKICENLKNEDGMAVSYNSLANIYLSLKNYDSTLYYYKKSYKIYQDKSGSYQKALLLDNISMVYVEKNIADSAYIYSKLAREEAGKIDDTYLELQVLLNATGIEELLGHPQLQLEIAERALFLADSLQVPVYQIYTKANYASALQKNKKNKEALQLFNSILPEAKAFQSPDLMKELYSSISEIHDELNRSDSAFKYFKLAVAMQDSMDKQLAADKVNELIARNQLENKENKILYEKQLRKAEKEAFEVEKESLEETQKWQWWIILISILGITLTVVLLVIISKRLAENRKLNKLMKERNTEIIEKNNLLHESKQEIISSITYAKRIQYALLAHDDLLKKNLPEHFVLFRPKDIVSGDFYWATEKSSLKGNEKEFYLAVCDSTGHGVPGAFMSLLNISFLNEAINEKNISTPDKVLNHVRERLIKNMEGAKDGMDAILIRFNGMKMQYAAAHNQPVVIRNGEKLVLKADKLPVGLDERNENFSLFEFEFQKNDLLFLITDGYADQFGGPHNKKFKTKRLHELLASCHDKSLDEMNDLLIKTHENWKMNNEQIDDICIIGMRI